MYPIKTDFYLVAGFWPTTYFLKFIWLLIKAIMIMLKELKKVIYFVDVHKSKIKNNLKEYWPSLKLDVLQIQGSVETANQDIEKILCVWMQTNKTTSIEGLRSINLWRIRLIIQALRERRSKLFWVVKVGLTMSSFSQDILKHVQIENNVHWENHMLCLLERNNWCS